tara:strand:+ start:676 stop:1392 length:717 start_codon:yes stop_codon:yes gene_type:complete
MTDLDVTMPTEPSKEHIAPTNNDKRMIDNFQYSKPLQSSSDDFEEEVKEVKEEPELEVKPVISDKVVFGEEEEIPSPKATKKQVASDKQREHLKKAREKALATRRANSAGRKKLEEEKKALRQQKREEKEKALIEKEEQEHQLNQSKPQVSFAKPEVAKQPASLAKVEVKPHSYMNEFSQEQIMELQQQAIENYEVKRKKAKQVKKETQQKENADKKIYESISKAVGPVSDPWADCFR